MEKLRAALKSLTFEETAERERIFHLVAAARTIEGKLKANKYEFENPLSAAYLYNNASQLYKKSLEDPCTRTAYNEKSYPILLQAELRALDYTRIRAGHEATWAMMLDINAQIYDRSAQIYHALGQPRKEREALKEAHDAYIEISKKQKYKLFSSPQRMEDHAQVQVKLVFVDSRLKQLEKAKRR